MENFLLLKFIYKIQKDILSNYDNNIKFANLDIALSMYVNISDYYICIYLVSLSSSDTNNNLESYLGLFTYDDKDIKIKKNPFGYYLLLKYIDYIKKINITNNTMNIPKILEKFKLVKVFGFKDAYNVHTKSEDIPQLKS